MPSNLNKNADYKNKSQIILFRYFLPIFFIAPEKMRIVIL